VGVDHVLHRQTSGGEHVLYVLQRLHHLGIKAHRYLAVVSRWSLSRHVEKAVRHQAWTVRSSYDGIRRCNRVDVGARGQS